MAVVSDILHQAVQAGCRAIFDRYGSNGWREVPLVELIEVGLAAQPEQQGAPGVRTTGPITSWSCSEARTHFGQLVSFGAPKEDLAAIQAAMARVTSFDLPETHKQPHVRQGGFGSYTRYNITQHQYAGGVGFIEALEIHDAPDGRVGFVVHKQGPYSGTVFWEFDTAESAVAAWEACWGSGDAISQRLREQPGFLRQVDCGALTPWFYAIGGQELIKDFAFPERVQDDPYYTIGRQFVVTGPGQPPTLKTCIGSRQYDIDGGSGYRSHKPNATLVVYWDDGTSTEVHRSLQDQPRPLHESENWVVEAISRFKELLAGGTDELEIQFMDGGRFVGRYLPASPSLRTAAGRYEVIVTFSDGSDPKSGWFDFEPTTEHPHLLSYLQSRLDNIQSVQVVSPKPGRRRTRRRWAGVYHSRVRLAALESAEAD